MLFTLWDKHLKNIYMYTSISPARNSDDCSSVVFWYRCTAVYDGSIFLFMWIWSSPPSKKCFNPRRDFPSPSVCLSASGFGPIFSTHTPSTDRQTQPTWRPFPGCDVSLVTKWPGSLWPYSRRIWAAAALNRTSEALKAFVANVTSKTRRAAYELH